jgi:purine-binding chemotaxis protein CheW
MVNNKMEKERDENTAIDWPEINRRMDEAWRRLNLAEEMTDEEKQKILKARARELAIEKKAVSEDFLEIVKFRLAYEDYGIETAFIYEVYPLKEFTPLPCVPSFVFGLINVRGQILSVVDLKKFFNLPEKGLGDLNKVIILKNDNMEFGILADVIIGTQRIFHRDIQQVPVSITGIGADYLKGVANDGTIILDAVAILGDKRMIVNEEAG